MSKSSRPQDPSSSARLSTHLSDEPPTDAAEPRDWREKILSALLTMSAVMGLFAIVPAIPLWTQHQSWGLAAASLLTWLWVLLLLFWKKPGFRFRAGGALLNFLFVGLYIYYQVGPQSSASAYLFSFSVLAGILLGFWGAIFAVCDNAAGLAAINILYFKGLISSPGIWFESPDRAISVVVNFLILNIIVAVSVSVLFRGLGAALRKEEETASNLKREQQRLQQEVLERRETEKALRASEELFRVLADESPLGISLLDAQNQFKYVNPRFSQIFGYRLADLPRGLDWMKLAYPDPEYRRRVIATWKTDAALGTTGALPNRVFNVACRDGETKAIHFRPAPLADGSHIVIYEDISDRVKTEKALGESEKRFRELADFLPEATYEADMNGRLLFLNQKGFELLQATPDDLAAGLNLLDFIGVEDRDKSLENLHAVLEGTDIGLSESLGLKRDGSTFPALVRNSAILQDGRPVGIRGVILDVTESKKLESQLRQAQKMEALGVLAGGIAHDFNNILAIMTGYLEVARGRAKTPEMQESLDRLQAAGHRAADLVKRILTFSRRTEQALQPVNLVDIVRECLTMVRAALPSTIEIEDHITSERVTALADWTQIQQVIINLCTNASHAMGQDGGTLGVGLSLVREDDDPFPAPGLEPGKTVRLWVADTGTGIPPDIIHRIFDPYFTTKGVGEGAGLGLSLVHGIVERHGGIIKAGNNSDQGACFEVFLPVIDAAPATAPARPEGGEGGAERIMFVDDERELVDLGRELLQELGYRVEVFTNGTDALGAFAADPEAYDLVVTDQTMPRMTGLQLARELARVRPDIPIVICSGFTSPLKELEPSDQGRRAFLNKPFKIKELARVVRDLLDRPNHRGPDDKEKN
ncbi:MAG: PAS domain S-box protein [Pseudomonadota bacterium]